MAAPSIRGTTAPVAGLSATSPSATTVGDLVVVFTWERAGAGIPTHTLQGTFVEIRTQPHEDGLTDGRLSVAYKVATAAGATSYQAYTSSVGTETWTGILALNAGTYSVNPLPASAGVTQTTGVVPNPPQVTGLTAAVEYLFAIISSWHLGSSLDLTPTHAVYTLRAHVSGAATGDVALGTLVKSGVTSEDPVAWGDDHAPNGTSSITIAFQPPNVVGADGSAAGVAVSSSAGVSVFASATTSGGVATTSASAAALWDSVYESVGFAVAASVAVAVFLGSAMANGVASLDGAAAAISQSVGESAGTGTGVSTSASLWPSTGASAGEAASAANGSLLALAVGSSDGVASADAAGAGTGAAEGQCQGAASAQAFGSARVNAEFVSVGGSVAVADGENAAAPATETESVGSAGGSSAARGAGTAVVGATGSSSGRAGSFTGEAVARVTLAMSPAVARIQLGMIFVFVSIELRMGPAVVRITLSMGDP